MTRMWCVIVAVVAKCVALAVLLRVFGGRGPLLGRLRRLRSYGRLHGVRAGLHPHNGIHDHLHDHNNYNNYNNYDFNYDYNCHYYDDYNYDCHHHINHHVRRQVR